MKQNVEGTQIFLAGLALTMLLSSLSTSIANAGLPILAEAFAAPFQHVQWVVLAYLVAVTSLIVGVGRLGDITGRHRLLQIGIVVFFAASVLCGIAPTLATLISARALQGLGAAIMMALSVALVSESVPKEKIGRTMGLLGTTSAVGTALGPSLGGILTAHLGWPSMFLVNAPLAVVALFFIRSSPSPRADAEQDRLPFDLIGTLLLAGSLAAYAIAMTVNRGRFGSLNFVLLGIAVAGLVAFLVTQARIRHPLLDLHMFRRSALSGSLAMSFLVSTVMMSTLIVGPFYLSKGLGLGAVAVGVLLSVGPIVAALSGVPAGRVVDRVGATRVSLIGLAATIVGAVLLALLQNSGVGGYVAPMIVLTAGYAAFQAANNTAVMSGLPSEERGVVSGMLNLSRNLGLITGASVMGAVFAIAVGSADVSRATPHAIASGTRSTFALAALLLGAAALIALKLHRASPGVIKSEA